jgi:hypothetical protein
MKLRNILIALIIIGFSACTQKFCPTYAKADTQKVEKKSEKPL